MSEERDKTAQDMSDNALPEKTREEQLRDLLAGLDSSRVYRRKREEIEYVPTRVRASFAG